MRLEMRGIDKRFGGVHALKQAELSAEAGEILGVCGENGAGKSTLLKILTGVYPHSSFDGTIAVDGAEVQLRSPAAARASGIGIVHQELMLVPELSVAANLMLGREPRRFGLVDDLAIEAEARRLLDRFGVGGEIDPEQPVSSLGIGRQQIVEIVRALVEDVKILVLDEPTAALTSDETARLMRWLRELKARGTTCLYVSHRMDEIWALTDRVTVLRDGRTVGTVVTAQTKPQKVIAMMVGRELPDEMPRRQTRAPSKPLFEVDQLRMGRALDGVSLSVGAGEIVALAGALGSGRTALLSALFGLGEQPVFGTILVDGKKLQPREPSDAIRAGLALVPEDRKGRGLVLGLSVADNLALPERARGSLFGLVDDLASTAAAEQAVGDMRLRGQPDAEVATLSGGNQQKVVIGKWLRASVRPKVLLLDEPTRGVDVGAREEIYALLDELARGGTAILVASSDLTEVLRLAHRILVLRKGRVAGELAAHDASEEEIVRLSTGATAVSDVRLSAVGSA